MPKSKVARRPKRKPNTTADVTEPKASVHRCEDCDRWQDMIKSVPGVLNLMVLDAALKGPAMDDYYFAVQDIVTNLVDVAFRAIHGDERANDQLKAIEKLTYPEKYDLSHTKITELVENYHTPPSLARGWELRRIMDELSWVVEPAAGRPYLSKEVSLRSNSKRGFAEAFELAGKHWKPGSTLQSLAIRCYLDLLAEQEVVTGADEISGKSLERDLRKLRQWEADNPQARYIHGARNEEIVWRDYSDGWKDRRRARFLRGKKATMKKRRASNR
jgi:hypothetical protein